MPPLFFVCLRFADEGHVDDVGQIEGLPSGIRHDFHTAGDGVEAADAAANGAEPVGMVDGDRDGATLAEGKGKGIGARFLLLGIKRGSRQSARRALLVKKGFPVFRQEHPVSGVEKVVAVVA